MDPRRNATFALPDRMRTDNVCTELVSNKIDVESLGSGIKISGEYVSFPDSDANAAFNLLYFKSLAEFDIDSALTESDASVDSCHRRTHIFIERLCRISRLLDYVVLISVITSAPFRLFPYLATGMFSSGSQIRLRLL